jgi:signal recognition particle subunit SRP54
MIPGIGKQVKDMQVDEKQIDRVEAMILSMTPSERRNPSVIDGSRRRRIASGSGTSVQQVNQLLQQHRQMKKMMKQVAAGGTPAMPGVPGAQRPRAAGSRSKSKKRRR